MNRKQNKSLICHHAARSDRGTALISALGIALLVSIWMTGISAVLMKTYQGVADDRASCMLRTAAESSLEWALDQMNGANAASLTPANIGDKITATVPTDVLSGVASSAKLKSTVTVANLAAPNTSYIYDPKLPSWRVVTVDTYLGSPALKDQNRFNHKRLRVVLKPSGALVDETVTTNVPVNVPVPMIIANNIKFSGSGTINGSVHSNGDIALSGSSKVTGDVTTSGNFSMTGSGTITGGVQSLGNITLNGSTGGANSAARKPITALGSINTAGSSGIVNGDMSAGKDITVSASMNLNNSSISTNGKLTTSGSFSMTGPSTNSIFASQGQSASGSFTNNTGGDMITLGNFNLGWGSTSGKVYYGGSNQSPAYSSGAAMSTNGKAVGGLTSGSSIYQNASNTLSSALSAAAEAAKPVQFPPAAEHSPNAIELPANSFTKSGSNNITIPPAGYPADGEYYIKGPIDLSGSNNVTVRGKVSLSLEGPNAYIKMAGSNNVTLPGNDPANLQIRTNSSKDISFSGSTNVLLGYIYAPNANFSMSGSNAPKVGGLIANTITFTGSSSLEGVNSTDVFNIKTQKPQTTTTQVFQFNHWQAVTYQEI